MKVLKILGGMAAISFVGAVAIYLYAAVDGYVFTNFILWTSNPDPEAKEILKVRGLEVLTYFWPFFGGTALIGFGLGLTAMAKWKVREIEGIRAGASQAIKEAVEKERARLSGAIREVEAKAKDTLVKNGQLTAYAKGLEKQLAEANKAQKDASDEAERQTAMRETAVKDMEKHKARRREAEAEVERLKRDRR